MSTSTPRVYGSIEDFLCNFGDDSKGKQVYLVINGVSIPEVYLSGNDQDKFLFSEQMQKELGETSEAITRAAFEKLGIDIHLT